MSKPKVDLNPIIANVLRYGVTISSILVTVGVALLLLRDTPAGFPSNLKQLVATDFGKPTLSLYVLAAGLAAAKPLFIIQLGLLVLLATPVLRVAASIFLFLAERDMKYVVITIVVLSVLLFSIFVVGPYEAHIYNP